MDPVQKAVINHTFGAPLIRTKRAVISCNVCQIRFNSESQAEAHYKGNRHARRVKGIETSKSRPRESDKPLLPASTPSPSPTSTSSLGEASRADYQPLLQMEVSTPAPPPAPVAPPPVPESPVPLLPLPMPGGALVSSLPSQGGSAGARTPQPDPAGVPNGSPLTPTPESEEEKAKKLLYCALCKVAVNSLSQLEAHNKGERYRSFPCSYTS
ncbi:zinc finger protein 385A-like [Polyodon spathula]|uniref:zinc finger protein 385A-like n=1 Tax=Polyodon spathula TaxID=7913 RepID=UPI001B7E27B6|nr:zinc finger protein 385A-like [Polyodon spathula]